MDIPAARIVISKGLCAMLVGRWLLISPLLLSCKSETQQNTGPVSETVVSSEPEMTSGLPTTSITTWSTTSSEHETTSTNASHSASEVISETNMQATTSESHSSSTGSGSGSGSSSTGADVSPWEVSINDLANLGLGFVIDGPGEMAGVGYNIAPVNDWNSDGTNDIALRSYILGEAFGFVLFGGNYLEPVDLKTSSSMGRSISIYGIGNSIRSLDDVNGDGVDDLGIDDNLFDVSMDDTPEGRIYISWGQKQAKDFNFLKSFEMGLGSRVTGHLQNQEIGWLVGVGDINGDGLGDMAMNAGGDNVAVLLGSKTAESFTTAKIAAGIGGFIVESCGSNLFVRLGDINGDELGDFLSMKLGATNLCVIYGKTDTLPVSFSAIKSGAAGFIIDAEADYNNLNSFGSNGDGRGDFDGDGFDDVLLLATNAPLDRQVVMLRGGNPWPLASLEELRMQGRLQNFLGAVLPAGVVFVPDMNGDGRSEFLLGDVENSGGVTWLVFGTDSTEPIDLNLIKEDHRGILFVNTEEKYVRLGIDVAARDVTGDGFIDLLIGEDQSSPQGRTQAGRIYVIDGAALMALVASW